MLERIENILHISLGSTSNGFDWSSSIRIIWTLLIKEREDGTPVAVSWDKYPDGCGNPGLSRGYRVYKLLQLIEKDSEQSPEKEERDIKESEWTTN